MEYILLLFSILILLGLIVWSCEVFTNAIEHLGVCYNVGDGAVGSIFAAIGTALPETIVPLVAILGAYLFGGNLQIGTDIGMGAVLGSPFLLSTLAIFITGLSVLLLSKQRGSLNLDINKELFHRDLKFFLLAYSVGVLASFAPSKLIKSIIGVFLLSFYIFYAVRTVLKSDGASAEEKNELLFAKYLSRFAQKHLLLLIWVQIIFSILCIIMFSHLFVENIKDIAIKFNVSPMIVSLLLAPIATELPEMFNSIIWTRQNKDTLALSNITGAMVFQACIPMTIGVTLTPWILNSQAVFNILLVYLSVAGLFILTLKKSSPLSAKSLIISGAFYFVYLAYIFLH
ncbi:MAG: hypothetical protein PHV37_07100 [Candidatus Gastranaerophilales bacterium]|nr:hypothetical protein [Candidatus Gastranaerophilales bacterium]